MKKLAITEENGEPMAIPCTISQNCPPKMKYVELRTGLKQGKMSSPKCCSRRLRESVSGTLMKRET